MPDKLPETSSFIAQVLEYLWTALIGMGWYIWNNLNSKVSVLEDDLDKLKDDTVSYEYLDREIKPWMVDIKHQMDTLVSQTADVIKRTEYKSDIIGLHRKIDEVASNLNNRINVVNDKIK